MCDSQATSIMALLNSDLYRSAGLAGILKHSASRSDAPRMIPSARWEFAHSTKVIYYLKCSSLPTQGPACRPKHAVSMCGIRNEFYYTVSHPWLLHHE